MKPLWWEIAYRGGQVAKGRTRREWNEAPQDGVLVARQVFDRTYLHGRTRVHFALVLAGEDYYWLGPRLVAGAGNVIAVPEKVDERSVKRGAWAERDEFLATYNRFLQAVPAEG